MKFVVTDRRASVVLSAPAKGGHVSIVCPVEKRILELSAEQVHAFGESLERLTRDGVLAPLATDP